MIAERLAAQMLSGPPARTAVDVTRRLLAVQGQDPRGARLAIRCRSAGLTAADVDRALSEERSLLITWCNRGTLHLLASEDYPWLHALTTPPLLTANARRLAEEGLRPMAAERGVELIERVLAAEGPLGRTALRDRLQAAGIRTEGQALVHLLMLASLRGLIVRGPMHGREHAYALVADWLPRPARIERDRALAELARRYLAGHGPAEDRDLARWAGLPLRDARAGLRAIAPELRELPGGMLDLERRACADGPFAAAELPPRLLGAFDPLLLGWRSRAELLHGAEHVVTRNGIFRPFALVRGRAAGTWTIRAGAVVLEPLRALRAGERRALAADGEDVVRFLGL